MRYPKTACFFESKLFSFLLCAPFFKVIFRAPFPKSESKSDAHTAHSLHPDFDLALALGEWVLKMFFKV